MSRFNGWWHRIDTGGSHECGRDGCGDAARTGRGFGRAMIGYGRRRRSRLPRSSVECAIRASAARAHS